MNLLDFNDTGIMVYKAGLTFKFSFTNEGFLIQIFKGAQHLGSFGRTYKDFIDQIEDEEDWHNFVDDQGDMHLCMKCGDGADGLLHLFDPNVTTTPIDDLDNLLELTTWDEPDEDLPLAQVDNE